MKEINKEELIDRYNAGIASEDEKALVESWYLKASFSSELPDAEQVLRDQVNSSIMLSKHMQVGKTVKLWPKIVAVAAVVAMVVFGVWFFNRPTETSSALAPALAINDIAPGKNGATLTLANGKVIELSDAKSGVVIGEDLKYNDGEILRDALDDKGAKSMMLTAETQKGQTYEFTLPDGTKVWLNAASKLSIPLGFSGTETRKVELTGEAYFEVAKNKKRRFIVESKGQEVTVLGTYFNISAYEDEKVIRTTLLEGSVDVNGTIIKPNQQATLTANNTIKVKEVDAGEFVLWKDGKFSFASEEIGSVMNKVSRWYNVDVIYKDDVQQIKVNGSVSRFANVSTLLAMLEETGLVHFKIEGRKVYVSK